MPYTIDGSPALEARIRNDMAAIREAVLAEVPARDLTALVLGGGYGRQEGGVFVTEHGEQPFNDYDLFVVVPFRSRRRRARLHATLNRIGERLSERMGVDVDFSRPIPSAGLPRLGPELMWLEMRQGHCVFHGPREALAAVPAYTPADLPALEGTRLLLNRGVGLLLARRQLARVDFAPSGHDLDFVVRNIRKAEMALGDVVLQATGRYVVPYRERSRILDNLEPHAVAAVDLDALKDCYREAIAFKLRPVLAPPPGFTLIGWWNETVRLFETVHRWFEARRLGLRDLTWEHYVDLNLAASPGRGPLDAVRQVAHNLSAFGPRVLAEVQTVSRPPRERLLKALPYLLYGDHPAAVTRGVRQCLLGPRDIDMETLFTRCFLPVWMRYN